MKNTEGQKVISTEGHNMISEWFGLSYASFLTIPRVLIEAMPDEWQKRFAELLFEYDAAFPNQPDIKPIVVFKKKNRFVSCPDFLLRYRHPDYSEIDKMRGRPVKCSECNGAGRILLKRSTRGDCWEDCPKCQGGI